MSTQAGGWLGRVRAGLRRTRDRIGEQLGRLAGASTVSPEDLEQLEEALLESDVGPAMTQRLLERLERGVEDARAAIQSELEQLLSPAQAQPLLPLSGERPRVWLLVGVNGSGKTTTTAKLAQLAAASGARVLIVAADTFRAAANEQLRIWAQRVGADFVGSTEGSDPAAVVYDGLEAARSRGTDLVLVDTAGRLHTKTNLMQELAKLGRVTDKVLPGAPHEVLLVLDGTTGRNALVQAREFSSHLPLTGVIVTKLDGTARGGSVVAVAEELGLPLRWIGVGETAEDLLEFRAADFARALVGE